MYTASGGGITGLLRREAIEALSLSGSTPHGYSLFRPMEKRLTDARTPYAVPYVTEAGIIGQLHGGYHRQVCWNEHQNRAQSLGSHN